MHHVQICKKIMLQSSIYVASTYHKILINFIRIQNYSTLYKMRSSGLTLLISARHSFSEAEISLFSSRLCQINAFRDFHNIKFQKLKLTIVTLILHQDICMYNCNFL